MRKAQAAMEFLMTYGWAILVVLVVIGALAYFGVLSPSSLLPERCTLPLQLNCRDFNVDLSSAKVSLRLQNSMGKNINIDSFLVNNSNKGIVCKFVPAAPVLLDNNKAANFQTNACSKSDGSPIGDTSVLAAKQKYSIKLVYSRADSSLKHTLDGELLAKGGGSASFVMGGDSAMLGWWRFDFDAKDSSGMGNDGSISAPVYSSKSGTALAFDKSNTVAVTSSLSLAHDGSYSIAAWFYLNSWTNYNAILSKSDYGSNGPTQYQMQMTDSIQPKAVYTYAGGNGGIGGRVDSAANFVETKKWIFAVITQRYNSATGKTEVKFYKNGALYSSGEAAGKTLNAVANLGIGNSILDGYIDELRIYKRLLVDSEIQQLYNGQDVRDSTLVAEWKFDEYSGSSILDSSGNSNNGAVVGTTRWSSKYGSALIFDGSKYANIPNIKISSFANGFTWSAWVRTKDYSGGWQWLFSASKTAGSYSWFQCGKKSGSGDVRFETGSFTSNTVLDTSGISIADGSWHHLACVWDKSSSKKYIYVDGAKKAEANAALADIAPDYGNLYIGAHPGPAEFWNGLIDEAQVYTRALTPQEIAALAS